MGIESGRLWQRDPFDDFRPRFNFPNDLQLFAEPIVFDGCEREEMVCAGDWQLHGWWRQAAGSNIVHDPWPGANLYQLSLFGEIFRKHGVHKGG